MHPCGVIRRGRWVVLGVPLFLVCLSGNRQFSMALRCIGFVHVRRPTTTPAVLESEHRRASTQYLTFGNPRTPPATAVRLP
jgi:hypothetical protein